MSIVHLIEEECGFKLSHWQRRLLEAEFPTRLPRKIKKRIKKNKISEKVQQSWP